MVGDGGVSGSADSGIVAGLFTEPFMKLVVTMPTGAPAEDIALLRLNFLLFFLPFPPPFPAGPPGPSFRRNGIIGSENYLQYKRYIASSNVAGCPYLLCANST